MERFSIASVHCQNNISSLIINHDIYFFYLFIIIKFRICLTHLVEVNNIYYLLIIYIYM